MLMTSSIRSTLGVAVALACATAAAVPVGVSRNNTLSGTSGQIAEGQSFEFPIDFQLFDNTTGFKATVSVAINGASFQDLSLQAWIVGPLGFYQDLARTDTASSQKLLAKDDTMQTGDYTLYIKGNAKQAESIVYSIAVKTPDNTPIFTSPVSNVPEPETYAMMLAGMAAIGFLARRRTGG